MNIGIFTETYYPQINGVVTSIRALEKELNKQGHKVYIFATTHPEAKQTARVFRLPSMPFWSMPSHRVAFSFSPQALKLIKSLDLDIIHTQVLVSMALCLMVIVLSSKLKASHLKPKTSLLRNP